MRKEKGGCALSVALRWSLCCGGLLQSRSGVAKAALVTHFSLSCSNPQFSSYLSRFLYTWWDTPRLLILPAPFSPQRQRAFIFHNPVTTEATVPRPVQITVPFDALQTTTGDENTAENTRT
jgi:hypothetical protein